MDLASVLVKRYFGSSDGELLVGGVRIGELATRYGTPLFVYDSEVMARKLATLRGALPPGFAVYYSVKANPNPAILKHFLGHGCGLEIASGGEFHLALQAGCPPEQILFAGPGKTDVELELVLKERIGEIHAESLLEIERIAAIARRLGVRAQVTVRVNPGGDAQGGALRMGGRPAPFGIDEELLDSVLERLLAHDSIEFRGIHLFTGTQILDYSILAVQYRRGLQIAGRAAERLGRPIPTLDFGGGLGIPYFPHDQELDMQCLGTELAALMTEVRSDQRLNGTHFVLEPGRYLVAEAGIYVARVIDIKTSRGKKFLIVDGGMHHHLAASGNLGQTIKRSFPVALVNKLHGTAVDTVDVVGPLCTPLDVLARGIALPEAAVGDLVGVFQSGAYGRSASPLGFLSHPAPPEVLVDGGQDQLIRRRGRYDACLQDCCLPASPET
jgi:diaminopimelate decarboxylase